MKKGSLSANQIILIILAIMGFLAVLGFLFASNLSGFSEDEICKLSVLTRATSPEELRGAAPLKCSTKKICLTSGLFGECEQFLGEENVESVRVSGNFESKAEQIEEASARAMYECWDMMGREKLDIFGSWASKVGVSSAESSCVICSRIALSDDISDEEMNQIFEEINLNRYLRDTQVPGQSLTYMQAFTDSGVRGYPSVDDDAFESKLENVEELGSSGDGREVAFVFMQIKQKGFGETFTNLGKYGFVAAGATFMTPGVGTLAKRAILTPYGLIAGVVAVAGTGIYVADQIYDGRIAAAGYCGGFTSNADEAAEGCSLVQAVPYTFKEIDSLCNNIQGNL
jgi:hypothetical protein